METKIVSTKEYNPMKENILQKYSGEDYQIFCDLVALKKPGKKYGDILDDILSDYHNHGCINYILITTKICHAPGVNTNSEGVIHPLVQFKISQDAYQFLKSKFETKVVTRYCLDRRITVEIFGSEIIKKP